MYPLKGKIQLFCLFFFSFSFFWRGGGCHVGSYQKGKIFLGRNATFNGNWKLLVKRISSKSLLDVDNTTIFGGFKPSKYFILLFLYVIVIHLIESVLLIFLVSCVVVFVLFAFVWCLLHNFTCVWLWIIQSWLLLWFSSNINCTTFCES